MTVQCAALRWTCSILEILTIVCGSHIAAAYSSCGLTRVFIPWHLCFNIAPYKVKCTVCIASYLVDVWIPGKGATDINPKDTLYLWQTPRPGNAVCNLFLHVTWIPSHASPGTSKGWTLYPIWFTTQIKCWDHFEVLNCHPLLRL